MKKLFCALALAASLSACATRPAPPQTGAYSGDGGKPGQTLPPRNSDQ